MSYIFKSCTVFESVQDVTEHDNIMSGIFAKYHVQIMPLFVYTSTHKRFVIFTCRYFNQGEIALI